MIWLQNHLKTIFVALAIAAAFAAIDLYVINLSSYLCGGLLAGLICEIRKPAAKPAKPEPEITMTGGQTVKCNCGGKLRKVAERNGVEVYRCKSCHIKYEKRGGKLKQVAV